MEGVEIWKDIAGYDGKYEVSSYGNVRNKHKSKSLVLKPKHLRGFTVVHLFYCKNKYKEQRMKELVIQYFVENDDPKNKTLLKHHDGDTQNIRADNLSWVSPFDDGLENWKDVVGYEEIYKISTTGKVWNKECNKFVKQFEHNKRLKVTLICKNIRRMYFVDELVNKHFDIKYKQPENQKPNNIPQIIPNVKITQINDNEEVWVDISQYPKYQVSNYGNVRSKQKTTILNQRFSDGFCIVTLHRKINNNKNNEYTDYKIAYLVATYFIKNTDPKNKTAIKHIDDDVTNNKWTNLQWALPDDNNIIWKYIGETNNTYMISNYGRIVRNANCEYIKPSSSGKIRDVVILTLSTDVHKKFKICNLVAKYFVENDDPVNKTLLKHLDGDVLNNKADNLQWVALSNNENEEWKDIVGYENRYQISNLGQVKSLLTNKILTNVLARAYYRVLLKDVGGTYTSYNIHRLVAKAFIENLDPNKKIVDHIDNNKFNNKATNLRWVTHKENIQSYQTNFRPKRKVIQYKDNIVVKEWESIDKIVEENKHITRNRLLGALRINNIFDGYVWKYKDPLPAKKEIVLKDDEIFKNMGVINGSDLTKYEVSNYGNVRIGLSGKFLTPHLGQCDYYSIGLADTDKNKVSLQLHRLVATVFVKRKSKHKILVNHIDENKLNNHYNNLEWATPKENSRHSIARKVNQIDINTGKVIKTYDAVVDVAKAFNKKTATSVGCCCNGIYKTSMGFKWEYAD